MNYAACRRLTRENAKSFYFASFPLPRPKRDATYAVYSFCRIADDVVDNAPAGQVEQVREELQHLRELLSAIDRGVEPFHPLWGPFAHAVHQFRIPTMHFHNLLDGVESDLQPRRFANFGQLRDYCYSVASTVGLALCYIFEFDDERALTYAANMGIAMQLTNIARDVGTDYRLGRVYLPLDEMHRFGVTERTIAEGRATREFRGLMELQIARAREYYRRAYQGIRHLKRDGSHWTAFLMGDVYGSILTRIENNGYDVFSRRAALTAAGKMTRAALAPWNFWRHVLRDTPQIMALPERET